MCLRGNDMNERRDHVPFDPYYFERLRQKGAGLTREETFRLIRERSFWTGSESVSGAGSGREQTHELKIELPRLVATLGAESMLDLPCGDFTWMQEVELPISSYVGADIIPELIDENRRRFATERRTFEVLDLTTDDLPHADLLLCRDALVHLSFSDIRSAMKNVVRSGIPYVLLTTFPECTRNEDITTGDWRLLNFEQQPFCFPAPLFLLNEGCTEGEGRYRDKSLGLWRVADVREAADSAIQ